MPMLPWLYARQAFCSQPEVIEFKSGQGVRYLTFYSQDPSPVLDHQIFYTFQGISEDGKFYITAFFPVASGVFPVEPPPCPKCGDADFNPFEEWNRVTGEQLEALNALEPDAFSPTLSQLDEAIRSLQIGD